MDDLAALGRVLKYIVNPTSCGQQSYQAHQDLSPGFEADLDDAITAMIQHPTDVAALVKRFEQLQDRHTNYNQEPVAAGNVTVQFNAQQEPRPWTQTSKRKCRAPPLLQEKTALGEQSAQLQANNWVNVVDQGELHQGSDYSSNVTALLGSLPATLTAGDEDDTGGEAPTAE
eukprot:TRINITY_DN60231_c0_g1_i1.p1 TRINITY_DN60231_c0_g1~~TRINITY_DN60231_c0_g1_i1.p1  ORF type:complete len:172 (+),score=18.99 TRINITY_DN60231_c0_g1_i1:212-727(+)